MRSLRPYRCSAITAGSSVSSVSSSSAIEVNLWWTLLDFCCCSCCWSGCCKGHHHREQEQDTDRPIGHGYSGRQPICCRVLQLKSQLQLKAATAPTTKAENNKQMSKILVYRHDTTLFLWPSVCLYYVFTLILYSRHIALLLSAQVIWPHRHLRIH